MGYSIINEKMCFDGRPCRLELGNLEQLKVLREHEDRVTKLNHAGLPVEPKYRIKFNFRCVFGTSLELDEKVEDEPIFEYEPGETITCYNCDREYEIRIPDEEYLVQCIGKNPR